MQALHHAIAGEGTSLVLLHGFCEDHSVWAKIAPILAGHHKVICLDLPGFGQSASLPGPFSIDTVADTVHRHLTKIGALPCIMVGHSLGGYVALSFAERHGHSLHGLGMMHSTAFDDEPAKRKTRNRVVDFVKAYGVPYFAESFMPGLFYNPNSESLRPMVKKVVETAKNTPLDVVIQYTLAMRDRPNRLSVLKNAQVPVLFVAGVHDQTIPIAKSKSKCTYIRQHKSHSSP